MLGLDWIGEKLKEGIEEVLNGWVEDFMNWILVLMNELVFKIPESTFVDNVTSILVWFTGIFAVVVALYKVVEYLINIASGTQDYPFEEIVIRVIKSSVGILVLPWFLKILMLDIALPLANYFASTGTNFEGSGGYVLIGTVVAGSGALAIPGGGIVLTAIMIFFLIVFIMFMYSVCVFYADYIMMQILIAPVCLSMIADDNNYFQVWWRELLSMVTSLLVKIILLTLIINILFTGGNILLAIGAGAAIIKSPSVLKNMWYGGGGTRALARGTGTAGSMGSRMLLMKMLK